MLGFEDFFADDYIKMVLSWQYPLGCYSMSPKLLDENVDPEPHQTAVTKLLKSLRKEAEDMYWFLSWFYCIAALLNFFLLRPQIMVLNITNLSSSVCVSLSVDVSLYVCISLPLCPSLFLSLS